MSNAADNLEEIADRYVMKDVDHAMLRAAADLVRAIEQMDLDDVDFALSPDAYAALDKLQEAAK